MELPDFRRGYDLGYRSGFAAGIDQAKRQSRQPRQAAPTIRPEDAMIAEYLGSQSTVRCSDLIAFLGITDDRGGRITVGHAMKRLGWIKRREAAPSRQWYYVRGSES